MKILVVGDWGSDIHEKPLADAFEKLGHSVSRFAWGHRFNTSIAMRLQNKFLLGPVLRRINRDLKEKVHQERPNLVFVYRGSHVFRRTIEAAKSGSAGSIWFGYNNDDPFSPRNPFYLWRHFRKAIPTYDLVFAYRTHNVEEYRAAGAKRVELLRSWFIPERNRKVELSSEDNSKYGCDVAFIGHYERDGRSDAIEQVIQAGFDFKLYGPEWHRAPQLKALPPPRGEEYNKAVNGAKICLCFLSALNRDTYTRRCFEIPAAGSLLLTQYSDDIASLFKPGLECETFRTGEELVQKLKSLLGDPQRVKAIAEAGMRRVHEDRHDVVSRAREILEQVTMLEKR
jgi:spore maturation protein CgeB